MNKKTLVTGASGLVGVYLIRELLKKNEQVTAIYRTKIPSALTATEQAQVNWVQGDILDVVFLAEVMEGCDKVYHCAGLVSFSPRKVKELHKINVDGTANVVNASLAAGIKKLIQKKTLQLLSHGVKEKYHIMQETTRNLDLTSRKNQLA